ncbi:DUF167 family protein [Consotaella aegiceratis]|uniref:DUF167 family protein n=1 Tax=Consotaella aegiceratis TaxID=3097961 RepID=UPI002F412F98
MPGFYDVGTDGVTLRVRLTPKSSADRIEGVRAQADGREYLDVRVRAVPEKGKANTALEALVAKSLHLPKSSVGVTAGETSRLKLLRLDGDPEELVRHLARIG